MDWSHVEKEYQPNKNENASYQTDPQQYQFSSSLIDAEGDEGHDGVGDEEAKDEPEEVSVVVYPGKKTREEEDCGDSDQLEDGHLWILETWPLMDDLHDAAGQESKVRPGRTHLSSVGNKDGGGEVADHP